MRCVYYEERQNFPLWLWVLSGCVFAGISIYLIYVYIAVSDAFEDYVVLTWAGLLLMDMLMSNLFYMTTRVSERKLIVRFGKFFPMMTTHIPLSKIHDMRVVDYNPLWDAGGWGYRYGRFEGKPTRFLNAKGNRGVFLEGKGHRYVIGSQEPERLFQALQEHIAPPPPPTEAECERVPIP